MTPARTRRGLLPRVIESWWAPARVVRGLRGIPEGALLAVLMAAMAIFLIAQMPGHARAAQLDPSIPMSTRMAGAALAVMFLMPLLAYALAALTSALSRVGPRLLGRADARLALFWALLAVAPAMLLAGLVAGLLGPGPALSLTRAVAGLGFLLIWFAGMAALAGGRMSLSGFLSAVQLTLRDPDGAVAALRALRLRPAEVMAAAVAVAAVSTLLGWPAVAAAPFEEGTVWALFARAPFVFAASQLGASLFGAALMSWAGRAFGGLGSFWDCLLALVWVQVILTALEAVQALLMLLFPPVAGILSLLGFALFLYLIVRFATAVHGFSNPALVLVGMVGTLILAGLVLSIFAGALGLLPEPAP